MEINDHIQQEIDQTLSLLEHPVQHRAPDNFLENLNARMEREEQSKSRFYRSSLLKAAAVVAFIAMNTYTWFSAAETTEAENYAESVFESYTTEWSNVLSYE
jgi:hypothetical protein